MSQGRGSKAQFRAYYETSYGEAPSSRQGVRLPAVDINIALAQSLVDSRVLRGDRNMSPPTRDQKTVSGNTTIQPDVRSIGFLLRHLFGSYSVSASVGTPTGIVGGTGYTVPTVTFSAPNLAGGVQATGTAAASGGVITGVTITNPGTGYTSAPTVTFGGGGTGASATGALAAPYVHLFKVADLAGSYMLEKYFSDLGFAYQYTGCKPNTLSWDIGTGGLQECTFGWIGQDELYAASVEDSTPTTYSITGFKVPSITLKQAGIGLTKATKMSLNVNNNITGTRVIGNAGLIADAPEGVMMVNGNFEVLFDSVTQYNKARNDTTEALQVTYPSGNYSLVFDLDEVLYEVASPVVPGPGGLVVAMNYRAFYDAATAASQIRATLTNDVPTYATIT